jgi:hypothetical protein
MISESVDHSSMAVFDSHYQSLLANTGSFSGSDVGFQQILDDFGMALKTSCRQHVFQIPLCRSFIGDTTIDKIKVATFRSPNKGSVPLDVQTVGLKEL